MEGAVEKKSYEPVYQQVYLCTLQCWGSAACKCKILKISLLVLFGGEGGSKFLVLKSDLHPHTPFLCCEFPSPLKKQQKLA